MVRLFFIYGLFICLLVAYGNLRGWHLWHSVVAGTWSPHGKSMYHK